MRYSDLNKIRYQNDCMKDPMAASGTTSSLLMVLLGVKNLSMHFFRIQNTSIRHGLHSKKIPIIMLQIVSTTC